MSRNLKNACYRNPANSCYQRILQTILETLDGGIPLLGRWCALWRMRAPRIRSIAGIKVCLKFRVAVAPYPVTSKAPQCQSTSIHSHPPIQMLRNCVSRTGNLSMAVRLRHMGVRPPECSAQTTHISWPMCASGGSALATLTRLSLSPSS